MDKCFLKEIEISNFKSIGDPVAIPITPITLLFGPNSSGKSSILQCLMMLSQSISSSNESCHLSPNGKLTKLKSYNNFIYQHDINKNFKFKFKFDISIFKEFITSYSNLINFKFSEAFTLLIDSIIIHKSISIQFIFNNKCDISNILLYLDDDNNSFISYSYETSTDYSNKNIYSDLNISNNENYALDRHWTCNPDHIFWKNQVCIFDKYGINNIIDHIIFESDFFNSRVFYFDDEIGNNERKEIKLSKEIADKLIIDIKKGITNKNIVLIFDYLFGYDNFTSFEGFLPTELYDLDLHYIINSKEEKSYIRRTPLTPCILPIILSNYIKKYLEHFITIGPFREYPERYYSFDEFQDFRNDSTGKLFGSLLCSDENLLKRVNSEIKNLNIFHSIVIDRLRNSSNEVENIFSIKFKNLNSKIFCDINDLGFGICQILPIIVIGNFIPRNKDNYHKLYDFNTVIIEQPELHLHPSMQAELGDFFIRAQEKRDVFSKGVDSNNKSYQYLEGRLGKNFIIETHSEHLILRLLRRIRETTDNELPDNIPPIRPEDITVLYVQPSQKGAQVSHIPITEDGQFACPWPQGFFPERARELF